MLGKATRLEGILDCEAWGETGVAVVALGMGSRVLFFKKRGVWLENDQYK
jgi:hypothetical protein